MSVNIYLPDDEAIDMVLAEFMGSFWCRYTSGQVVGELVVRFLASKAQFEDIQAKYGFASIRVADGTEPIEQLAFKAVPSYHSDLNAMAAVEARIYTLGLHSLYWAHLREEVGIPTTGALTEQQTWWIFTALPRTRARAAFLVIDAQRTQK